MRYRLIQDNDGHWYLIEHNLTKDFWHWVETEEANNGEELQDLAVGFDDCRISGDPSRVTFLDPKED